MSMRSAGEDVASSSAGEPFRFIDYVYTHAPKGPPSRPLIIDYQDFAKCCADQFVDPSGGEPITFKHQRADALSFHNMVQHCLDFIKKAVLRQRRQFYIGMTHDVFFRWLNEKFGHKWSREFQWAQMVVLAHPKLVDAHPIETAVVDEVYFHDPKKSLAPFIVNQPHTPPGAQVADSSGRSWVYALLGPI